MNSKYNKKAAPTTIAMTFSRRIDIVGHLSASIRASQTHVIQTDVAGPLCAVEYRLI